MKRYYAGIGRRSTPSDILLLMTSFASLMEKQGYILRSGGASGADDAFERGVKNPEMKQVFLPWEKFNGRKEEDPGTFFIPNTRERNRLVDEFHPLGSRLKDPARAMMARNVLQIMGPPGEMKSKFVVCWCEDETKGGTSFALNLAKAESIKIINLFRDLDRKSMEDYISKNYV